MTNAGSPPDESDLGVGFTEIFVKRTEYVSLLLSLLEEYDNYVRFYTVQVLTILLTNKPLKLQEVCYVVGAAVSLLRSRRGVGISGLEATHMFI